MKKLKLDLENCFGIQRLEQTIDYSKKNVAVIYAPNGTMKSSLAKTFQARRDGKPVEEKVFGYASTSKISDENDSDIDGNKIIVINPFEDNAYENQGMLMANDELRRKYLLIHKTIDDKKLNLYELVKEKLGFGSRTKFDVKQTMLADWNNSPKEECKCLETIVNLFDDDTMKCDLKHDELDYNALFNDKVYSMIKSGKTAELIEEYEKKYNELVDKSLYMQSGIIDHNNYGNISTSLDSNGFFSAKNEIKLNAKDGSTYILVKNQQELEDLIKKEKEQVLNTKEIKNLFEQINKIISKNKDTQAFNEFLQKHQEIIVEYKNIDLFKKKVWIKVFSLFKTEVQDLLEEYIRAQVDLKALRDEAREQSTDWQKALNLFKERFYVPFQIEPSNQDDVILNMDLPSFKYTFEDNRGPKEINKEKLLDVLSTGEKRAYYILNMIFHILVANKENHEYIIVLDDISESFDYRNKYAIIEYVNDIAQYTNANGEKIFNILLLTHNFDFYRTIASRITKTKNSYIAFSNDGKIELEQGQYTRNIFNTYKTTLVKNYNDNILVASIPFVRNLIEYTDGNENTDYLTLTSVLHYKDDTKGITLQQIEDIFNNHWCRETNISSALGRENETIYKIIMQEAEKIDNSEKLQIENKLILSMAIRLQAEVYMINKLISDTTNGDEIIQDIYAHESQSGRLTSAYKKYIDDEAVNVLDLVAMITPENIHLNSFMYEPILDMSVRQLFTLYQEVKNLVGEGNDEN